TLRMKATRLAVTPSSWAENPPSRTRRFVTNVRVHEGNASGEYDVTSSILLVRNRYDETHLEIISGRRADVIRRVGDGWKIARRTIYLDQATLSAQNLTAFL
ncbi:MAG: aromatic-ring-hydroxylating dioxygenase subunit beta, partial [Candidatus Binatia bacterium]